MKRPKGTDTNDMKITPTTLISPIFQGARRTMTAPSSCQTESRVRVDWKMTKAMMKKRETQRQGRWWNI